MLEPSGNIEILVVESATGEEESVVLTAKDFHPERRAMLDDDVIRGDESEYVAYASALDYEFKVVATPPNNIEFEDDPEEIRIEIIHSNLEFGEPTEVENAEP